MSAISDGALLSALRGPKGELDAWLELQSEEEVRAAILAVMQPQETLRDEFAGRAMQGICACGPSREFTDQRIAHEAYGIADAMLKAREVQP